MSVQIIEIAGQRMAVLPESDYRRLVEEAEETDDIRAAEAGRERAAAGEEYVPMDLVDRLLAGENALKVWREYRGLSQQALAEAVGLSKVSISGIERGRQGTSEQNWRKLAAALTSELDDIFPEA